MNRKQHGFTVVELLIVIVVIAILAAITVVAYNSISTRSQASAILTELKATEKALRAYKVTTGTDAWWIDTDTALTGSGNPPISTIIATKAEFRTFLQSAPSTNGLGSGNWIYDNDGDTYNGCSSATSGVGLGFYAGTITAVMQAIDTAADDGSLSCGNIRYSGGWFIYGLAGNSSS